MPVDKQLLTLTDLVANYSISRSAWYRLFSEGVIKPLKVGRRTYVARSDVDAFVARMRGPVAAI